MAKGIASSDHEPIRSVSFINALASWFTLLWQPIGETVPNLGKVNLHMGQAISACPFFTLHYLALWTMDMDH